MSEFVHVPGRLPDHLEDERQRILAKLQALHRKYLAEAEPYTRMLTDIEMQREPGTFYVQPKDPDHA